MVVTLYTSRVVLRELGASDFGLYGVIAALVALLGFISASLTTTTQRFLNFEHGARRQGRLRLVFGTSLLVHLLLALVILTLVETLGLWFLNHRLKIDVARVGVANWVFQCAVASSLLTLLSAPYTAAIIANERMTAFAYLSIIDVSLRLAVAIALQYVQADKLRVYAVLMSAVSLAWVASLIGYSLRNFVECRTLPKRDPRLLKELLSFSLWNIISQVSYSVRTHGANILLNVFFGTIVNAATTISSQVTAAIQNFSNSFTQALNPQVVKSYAAKELARMHQLIFAGCKYAFFVVFLLALPLIIETDRILEVWLVDPPEFSAPFVRLAALVATIESFASILAVAQGATGRVKWYHLTMGGVGLLNLPISAVFLYLGAPPYAVLGVAGVISCVLAALRVMFLRKSIGVSLSAFARSVVARCAVVMVTAPVIPLLVKHQLSGSAASTLVVSGATVVSTLLVVWLLGLSSSERDHAVTLISRKLARRT